MCNAQRCSVITGEGGGATAEQQRKKITYNGNEYTLLSDGKYYRTDESGNLVDANGTIYVKGNDGQYSRTESNHMGDIQYVFDEDMNSLGMDKYGTWYDKKGSKYVKKDANGNYIDDSGKVYTKNSNGEYVASVSKPDGDVQYVYDGDMNLLKAYKNDTYYDKIIASYNPDSLFHFNADGSYASIDYMGYNSTSGTKNANGGYTFDSGYSSYFYDEDLNPIGASFNYPSKTDYVYKNGNFVREDENGNIYTTSPNRNSVSSYTKREDGLYENGNYVYDEELHVVGTK